MAFLKFSRDKRGYENFYLMQPTARGKSRPRLLYWFRTPPGVKVGRTPFDSDVRRALEAQNPDVAFDWTAIVQTPIPAADTERWRERRRVERAMRAASDADAANEGRESDAGPAEAGRQAEPETASPVAETPTTVTEAATAALPVHSVISVVSVPLAEREAITTDGPAPASNVSSPAGETTPGGPTRRRKRRRRGRRKAQVSPGFQVPSPEGSTGPEPAQATDPAANDAEMPEEELEP